MLTLVLVSYTATAMSLAISAGMDVVAIANLLITVCFVLMLVSIVHAALLVLEEDPFKGGVWMDLQGEVKD